jgi:hypothetical protein
MLSATHLRRKARQLFARLLGQRPKSAQAGKRRARGSNGPRGKEKHAGRGEEMGCRAESEEKGNFLFFSFSFSIISKHFQMILESNLNLNQTAQTKNSNATA